jgi:uncharacterized membrane protein
VDNSATTLVFLNDPLSPLSLAVFTFFVCAIAVYSYKTVRIAGARRSIALVGLRLMAVAAFGLVLLQPAVLSYQDTQVDLPQSFTHKQIHIPSPEARRKMLPPLAAFSPPEEEIRQDVRIVQLVAPPVAFLKSECTLSLTVINEATTQTGQIVVRQLEASGAVELSRRDVQLATGRKTLPVTLAPGRPGKMAFEVALERFQQDEVPENNRTVFSLTVARDSVRVLHIAGHPSWDTRFLRQLLKALPSVNLISFYLLVETEDFAPHSREELALIPFPTNELFLEEIGNFDLVIAQNFPLGTYFLLKEKHLTRLKRFIHEGGALLMLGGDRSYTLSKLQDTALAPALPMDLTLAPDAQAYVDEPTVAELTSEGRFHPIFAQEMSGWDSDAGTGLPPMRGVNVLGTVKKGATVLARAGSQPDSLPLMISGTHGQGRILMVASDSMWRWAFSGDDSARAKELYRQFFVNGLSWLTRDPRMASIKLSQDKARVHAGEENRARACLRGKVPQPVKVAITAQWLDPAVAGPGMKVELSAQMENGCASFVLPASKTGAWQVLAQIDADDWTASGSEVFVVEPKLPSYTQRLQEKVAPLMERRFYPFVLDPVFSVRLEQPAPQLQQPVLDPVWNHPALFLLLLVVILSEWMLRKRWGYL